jgi:hypothetical protein
MRRLWRGIHADVTINADAAKRHQHLHRAHWYQAHEPRNPKMKVIHLLYVVSAQAFYRWALREIDPMHPDVSKIVLRQHELAMRHRQIWS